MSVAAIIVAAGRGLRAGGETPKQYRRVAGRPMLAWSAEAFARHPRVSSTMAVIGPEDHAPYEAAVAGLGLLAPVVGGETRQQSVLNGLEALAERAPEIVLIHDAARPFLPAKVIDRSLTAIEAGADGACAALPVVDTLRAEVDGYCGALTPRDGLWRAQTPQAFRYGAILEAHREAKGQALTDDAELARAAGLRVSLVAGDAASRKITTPEDFDWAERWAAASEETRVGQGFDVHAFGPNADGSRDHVMLCGVRVPHEDGLKGHSDADVGLHAATDAILGAAALGDIGQHFPPSDDAWRGAASDQFLAAAMQMASEAGARLAHLDVTLICERPKIGPHAGAMRARMAEILGVDMGRVSVKATTTERLGFTGRGEGVAAMATATLRMRVGDGE